jgi:hypothetical protein
VPQVKPPNVACRSTSPSTNRLTRGTTINAEQNASGQTTTNAPAHRSGSPESMPVAQAFITPDMTSAMHPDTIAMNSTWPCPGVSGLFLPTS